MESNIKAIIEMAEEMLIDEDVVEFSDLIFSRIANECANGTHGLTPTKASATFLMNVLMERMKKDLQCSIESTPELTESI